MKGRNVMFISVMFKDRNKIFKGKTYDYKLSDEEEIPAVGSIIRMMDEEYDYICNGTRVKVVDVKVASETPQSAVIRYISSSLEE